MFRPKLTSKPLADVRAQSVRAFTLVELLVVVAIIGVMVGLLLPAIQRSRESARKVLCRNNLKQLSLATLVYESQFRHLPVGCAECRARGVARPRFASWIGAILPQLEEKSIYEQIDWTVPMWDYSNQSATASVIKGLLCPSTPDRDTAHSTSSMWRGRAFTDYGGLYGVEGPGNSADNMNATQTLAEQFLGVMVYENSTRLREVTDGTSRTAAVGEMLIRRQSGECEWINGHHLFAQEKNTSVNSASRLGNDIGSPHPGGAFAAFCDGHVEWLTNEMDQLALNASLTKAGGDHFRK